MKILVKKNSDAAGAAARSAGDEQSSFEIPNATIAGLGAILTAILTFATGISPIIKDWVTGVSYEKVKIELEKVKIENENVKIENEKVKILNQEGNYQLTVLKQALQNKTPQDRVNSLKLLISAGLLKDANGELGKMTSAPETVPFWEQQSNTTAPNPKPTSGTTQSNTSTAKPTS